MNIRKKIGLTMTALAFMIVIFVGIFSVMISRDTVKARGKDFLVSILNRTSYDINLQVNTMAKVTDSIQDEFLLTFNFSKGMTDDDYLLRYFDKFKGTLQLAAELSPSKSAYIILEAGDKSHVLWYKDDDNDGIPEAYEFDEQMNRFDFDFEASDRLLWINDDFESTISCIRVTEVDGTKITIGTDLNYYILRNNLDTSKYLDSGLLFLADQKGHVVYHPTKSSGSMTDIDVFDNQGFEAVEAENESLVPIVIAKTNLDNGWMLVISAETSDIFSGLDRLNYIILLILTIAIIIAFLYSYFVSKKIAEPYVHLTEIADQVGHGNYDVNFDEDYLILKDEIGIFTRAFKTAVARQKESFEKINNYNLNLEEIITERTEELINTNKALEESVINTEEKQEILEFTNQQLENSIDEIKKTRRQLIKSEKIASSRYMAIGMAHNLNTPIGSSKSIASFIENRTSKIMDKYYGGTLSKSDLEKFLIDTKSGSEKIVESIDHSIQLIEKMKALSILSSSENVSLVNVEEVIKLQVENSKREFAQMICGFTILVDADLKFKCDLFNLQKIIYELITNSYTHAFNHIDSPHITIKAHKNDMSDNGIIIEYFDNGVGVEKKHRSELFTPLYTTKLSSRDGLGLTMVYNLVNSRFNGDITAENISGRGLSFIIKLYELKEDNDIFMENNK